MYGRRKLRRRGHDVAFCTADRIMRELGSNGVVRGRRHRTTIPAEDCARATDRRNRDFTAPAPDRGWVADFTYVSTWTGWAPRLDYLTPAEYETAYYAQQPPRRPARV